MKLILIILVFFVVPVHGKEMPDANSYIDDYKRIIDENGQVDFLSKMNRGIPYQWKDLQNKEKLIPFSIDIFNTQSDMQKMYALGNFYINYSFPKSMITNK